MEDFEDQSSGYVNYRPTVQVVQLYEITGLTSGR